MSSEEHTLSWTPKPTPLSRRYYRIRPGTKPVVAADSKEAELRSLQTEVAELQQILADPDKYLWNGAAAKSGRTAHVVSSGSGYVVQWR